MKKIIALCLVILINIFGITKIYALDGNTGVNDEDSKQNISEMEVSEKNSGIEKQIEVDKLERSLLNNTIRPRAAYMDYTYNINVSNYTQEKGNWCGAATIRQSLSFHKSNSGSSTSLPTQTTLASSLGIANNSNGASSATMANVLNGYKSTFSASQSYIATDILDKTDPYDFLATGLKTQIKNKYTAPIILLDTGNSFGISQYKGVYIRHYNTISGYTETVNVQNGDVASRKIRRVDPHYSSTYRGIYTNDYSQIYQTVSQADRNGANKVLIY